MVLLGFINYFKVKLPLKKKTSSNVARYERSIDHVNQGLVIYIENEMVG
jgi:hypothetical protein